MTREQIDAIERLYIERSDSLDASSYSIPELLAAASRALELEEALAAVLDNPRSTLGIWRDSGKWFFAINGEACGEGATPLEAINNARRGM